MTVFTLASTDLWVFELKMGEFISYEILRLPKSSSCGTRYKNISQIMQCFFGCQE